MASLLSLTVASLLLSCGGELDEDLPESNDSIREEGEALQEQTVGRHRALLAKRVQYSHSAGCTSRIDAYQTEYDAVMNQPVDIPEEGERGVLLFWLNVYYEAAKVIDAHEPDINHYCR